MAKTKTNKKKKRTRELLVQTKKNELATLPELPPLQVQREYKDITAETPAEQIMGQSVDPQNSITSIGKQMFNDLDIDLKSEVSDDELKLITKIMWAEKRYGMNSKNLIDTFLRLRTSLDRKSRTELIEALKAHLAREERALGARMMGGGSI